MEVDSKMPMTGEKLRKVRSLTAMVFLAASGLVLFLPALQITIDNRVYQPTGFRLLLSALAWQGQIVSYPILLRAAILCYLLAIAASTVLAIRRKTGWAALASGLAAVLAVMVLLQTGRLPVLLSGLGAAAVLIRIQPALLLQVALPFLAAVLLLWSKGTEALAQVLFQVSAAISITAVAMITVYMLYAGIPAILEIGPLAFLSGTTWQPTRSADPQFGILPMILATIAGTFGAVLIGVPIGLLTAVFLAEISPRWAEKLVRPAIELLAGIPSVIYGFFGLQMIVPLVQKIFRLPTGASLFTAIVILAIMILPTIVSTAETGLRAVPAIYREASLALGATRIETIFKVTLPAARSPILSGIILGVGRAIGETMAVIMVAGNVPNLPTLFGAVRPLTVGIALEMNYAVGLHQRALFAIGLILFVFIMLVNLSFSWLSKKGVQISGTRE